jgi:hypothetical protein
MVFILKRWGFAAALGFARFTDLLSALLMGLLTAKQPWKSSAFLCGLFQATAW